MPVGIVIPVDEEAPIFRKEFGEDYREYQAVLGGLIQSIDLDNPPCSLFMDEEGKIKQLPMNRRATLLMWMHNLAFIERDVVCGQAILIGQPDEDGRTQDVPQELDDLLFDTTRYRAEFQTADEPDAWNTNQVRYNNWVDAYNHGLLIGSRWMAVTGIRVVPDT